jgi:hypothetical protein
MQTCLDGMTVVGHQNSIRGCVAFVLCNIANPLKAVNVLETKMVAPLYRVEVSKEKRN